MAQGGINPVQKSLFRASGLAFLTVYLIKTINTIVALQPPLQPAAVLRLTNELMDYSSLLAIGLLLLLLSLSDQFVVHGEPEEPRQLGLRDGLLLRARTLVGVLALLYLILPRSQISPMYPEPAAPSKLTSAIILSVDHKMAFRLV